jgi:membrane protease YdiL (CAAX protease family)
MTLSSLCILSATDPVNPMAALLPALLLGIGGAAAAALGVFRRGSIVGPARLEADEPLQPLAGAAALGLGVWFMGQVAFLQVRPALVFPAIASDESRKLAMAVTADLLARAAAVVIMLALVELRLRDPRRLGITSRKLLPGFGRGLLGALVTMPLMFLSLLAMDVIMTLFHQQQPLVHDLLKLFGNIHDARLHVVLLLSIIVAAPVSEELFFRGCLQTLFSAGFIRFWQGISPARARWLAVVITSLLFASVHPWWSAAPIFLLAICLGYTYERTGNLWASITIHALFNASELAIFWMQAK